MIRVSISWEDIIVCQLLFYFQEVAVEVTMVVVDMVVVAVDIVAAAVVVIAMAAAVVAVDMVAIVEVATTEEAVRKCLISFIR